MAELDGLRGLAALSVFFCHAGMFGPPWNVLAFLGDGSAAVDLFFVLSGFVLARSLLARRQNYWEFVWRRVARLYPAYWGAVLVALALMISSNRAGLAPLGDLHVWAKPITVEQLIKHFFLITPSIDVHWANYSIWSLVVEMRISLLFPLLLVGFVSLPGLARWPVLLLSPALALVPMFLLGIGHVPLFLLGLALAVYVQPRDRPASITLPLLLFGIALYFAPHYLQMGFPAGDYTCALGSGAIIVAAMSSPTARRILTVGPVRILGDISYSFYLLHLPILIFVTSWLLPVANSASCLATALAATCVTAFAFRQLIELPAMRKTAQRIGSPRSARILAPANQ